MVNVSINSSSECIYARARITCVHSHFICISELDGCAAMFNENARISINDAYVYNVRTAMYEEYYIYLIYMHLHV